ncbi:MAG: hypothetical protein A2Z20_01600 [Bdellovibrionales bacterium RBG_16_40_8]|nr:MAG: hypothetical protein A2Z20_01600 [Bdellovibrionales bacterium RBG_16_40_8]
MKQLFLIASIIVGAACYANAGVDYIAPVNSDAVIVLSSASLTTSSVTIFPGSSTDILLEDTTNGTRFLVRLIGSAANTAALIEGKLKLLKGGDKVQDLQFICTESPSQNLDSSTTTFRASPPLPIFYIFNVVTISTSASAPINGCKINSGRF